MSCFSVKKQKTDKFLDFEKYSVNHSQFVQVSKIQLNDRNSPVLSRDNKTLTTTFFKQTQKKVKLFFASLLRVNSNEVSL